MIFSFAKPDDAKISLILNPFPKDNYTIKFLSRLPMIQKKEASAENNQYVMQKLQ